jgi:hypothetical protein
LLGSPLDTDVLSLAGEILEAAAKELCVVGSWAKRASNSVNADD